MMDIPAQYILLLLAPVFVFFLAWEFIYLRKRTTQFPSAKFTWSDTISNGVLALLHEASDAICASLFIMGIYAVLYDVRLFEIPTTAASLILLFFLQDFFYYWFHRGSHRIRWMWASHVVHHSSERLNLSTAFRQSFTYPISGMWVFWVPIVFIGFEPEQVVAMVLLSLAYQFFVHTQVVPKLGPLEWIFNTPSHHRVHHARNAEYIDQNYGGVLIIWDRLFGTFVEEDKNNPCEFGIIRQVHSHNPIYLTLHEWKDMFADALTGQKSLWTRIKHFWAAPEWQPEEAASKVDGDRKIPLTGK